MPRCVVARSLFATCFILLGSTLLSVTAQTQDEWIAIKVVFCSDAVPPQLVSAYTGARLLSFKSPVARFAVPKNLLEAYGLLFETLPYTRLADPALRRRVQALRQSIAEQQNIGAPFDPNTLIVRFNQPDEKLLQEFALVYNVSIRQFTAPLKLALVETPSGQARVYYTFLRHAPHVAAVDLNTTSTLF